MKPAGTGLTLFHNGGTGGFAAFVGLRPQSEIAPVALLNSTHRSAFDEAALEELMGLD